MCPAKTQNGLHIYSQFVTHSAVFKHISFCPLDITLKHVFCLAFYFKWKYFVLIDHILSETICLFCFCVLFSNVYPKIKFTAKNWSVLCSFDSKVIFLNFCQRKQFLLFFVEFELSMFHNNIVKISEKLNKWNVENLPQNYLPYRFLHNLHSFVLWKKV